MNNNNNKLIEIEQRPLTETETETQHTKDEQWYKEKKLEILREGFPLVWEDMARMREKNYMAFSSHFLRKKKKDKNFNFDNLNSQHGRSFAFLKEKKGVYMITNNVTKKFYIGISINLYGRFQNYFTIKRLQENPSSRINRALLKFGYKNFTVSILEIFTDCSFNDLKIKEDFYIEVLKPQYNIKQKHSYNAIFWKTQIQCEIPFKVKNILDMCLDPNNLDWVLISFSSKNNKKMQYYLLEACSKNIWVKANSFGWFQGNINSEIGFSTSKFENWNLILTPNYFSVCKKSIQTEELANFYPKENLSFIKDAINKKFKLLLKKK